ncbi:MAG: DNA polymerase III subunit delta [Alphaproteobacteria bacterium]
MKVESREAASFAAKPPPKLVAALVYGPDQGLVRERADALVKSAADPADPFQVSELGEDALSESPGRLQEEAAAIPMLGGRRVVRVKGVSNALAGIFEALLEAPPGDAFIVAEAGELTKASALRRLFEQAKNAAAVPCYLDSEETLEKVVEQSLRQAGLAIEPAALAEAVSRLGSDRGVTRREVEKLVLYAQGEKRITREHVLAVMGDESELRMDKVCDAAGEGDYVRVDRELTRLWDSGAPAVGMIRVALGHFQRLLLARARMDAGASTADLIKTLRPSAQFSRDVSLRHQLTAWNVARLEEALELLYEAEVLCKTTAVPAEAAAGRALLQVASLAGPPR